MEAVPPMANVWIDVEDTALAITLKVMLEKAGHRIAGADVADVFLMDDVQHACARALERPTLLVATHLELPAAVQAMRAGVFGYVLTPLVPGEATIMVERAAGAKPVSADEPLRSLAEVERAHIEHVLRACKQNQAKAARILGIGRNTLWRKLRNE